MAKVIKIEVIKLMGMACMNILVLNQDIEERYHQRVPTKLIVLLDIFIVVNNYNQITKIYKDRTGLLKIGDKYNE